jgi:short-subunit dehydrogenase
MKDPILILGATSAMARAYATLLVREGHGIILAARDQDEVGRIADDLRVRWNAEVAVYNFDALDFASHEAFFNQCVHLLGKPLGGVVLFYGFMPDQKLAEHDWELCRRTIDTTFTSAVSVLNIAANYFEGQRKGFICGVSSVAGDRGRQSNYIYGSAKAGLTAYLQGLRNRLFHSGVAVITVKPGFTDTAMTWGLLKPGSPLVASPEQVARDIHRATISKRDVVYTLWFWRVIMTIICTIPERLFKRMKM